MRSSAEFLPASLISSAFTMMHRMASTMFIVCTSMLPLALSSKLPVGVDINVDTRKITVHDYKKEVCGIDCDIFCDAKQCPLNVGSIIATKVNATGAVQDYNVIVASTIGKPSIMLGHISDPTKLNISPSDVSGVGNFWVNAMQNAAYMSNSNPGSFSRSLDLLSFGPAAELGKTINTFGIQFESLFEYEDKNENGVFDNGVDVPLRAYDLERAWLPMTSNLTTVPGGAEVGTLSFTSADGVIKMVVETTSIVDSQPEYLTTVKTQLRTPSSARVAFNIDNFQYIGRISRLAFKATVISPQDSQHITGFKQFSRTLHVDDTTTGSSIGYLHWSATAVTKSLSGFLKDAGFIPQVVKATPMKDADLSSDVGYSLGKSMVGKAGGFVGGEAKAIYFTFADHSYNPSDVYWDMSVGLGSLPSQVPLEGGFGFLIILGTIIFAVTLCFVTADKDAKLLHPFSKNKLT